MSTGIEAGGRFGRRTRAARNFLACGAAVLLLAGCSKRESAAPQAAEPPTVVVQVVRPTRVPVNYEFIGQTEASQKVQIRARIRGFLTKRAFEEGGSVKEGDLLFEIDPRPFEADLQVAEARLDQAKASLAQATRELERVRPLVESKAVPQRELDDWLTRELEARASVRLSEATVAKSKLDLSYTKMYSPLTGTVGVSDKDVGALVDDGANSELAMVTQVDPIYVVFSISERELLKWEDDIRSGKVVVPQRDSLPLEVILADGRTYGQQGRINFVDVRLDPVTGTARLRAEFPNPMGERKQHGLLPGQFVRTRLLGVERVNAVTVPQDAVINTPGGAMVMLVNKDSMVEPRPIELGQMLGGDYVVESGLREGDRVIVEGQFRVRGKMPVRVAGEGPVAPTPTPTPTPTSPATGTEKVSGDAAKG